MKRYLPSLAAVLAASSLAAACGEDGVAGKAGLDGQNGANGVDGQNGTDGKNGVDGQNGANGVDGKDGTNGTNGTNGANGTDGTNGTNGTNGANGTNGTDGQDGRGLSTLSFLDVGFARTSAEKHQVRASKTATVNGVAVAIDYHTLVRSGQDPARADKTCDLAASPATCAGAQLDKNGQVMRDDANAPLISNQNDFSSLLEAGDKKFLVHSFESYPAPIYLTTLTQDDGTGLLTATATKNIDMSSVDGLYRTCAGSITPWGTHISAEESQVDARPVEAAATWTELAATGRYGEISLMGRYLGLDLSDSATDADTLPDIDVSAFHDAVSAYFYGYAVEVAVDANGDATPTKHYAMGRLGMELAYVMPDRRTVYLTDDVTNGTLTMFVADEAGDLSAGTLYAMRVYQKTPAGGEFRADIEWVNLGHATNDEIRALLHPTSGGRIKFADIFEYEAPVANACPTAGFTAMRANGDNDSLECLKLKPGMDLAASRLETRRYAVLKGATSELTKEEGLTYDPDLNRIYIALSDVTSSMGAQTGGDNHIDVAANRCGAVFALDVGPWFEFDGSVATEYAALNWYPLVAGAQVADYPASSPYRGNTCSVGGLASPDNVTYLPKFQTLVIGEDTGRHQNDAVWAYHMPSGRLTRILTTPYGAETTSPYWVPNFGGYGYLITAVQHPYGESDQARVSDADSTGAPSWIGVIGPFPSLD